MGAQLKLTPELQERVVELIVRGVPASEACQSVGVDRSTFGRWLTRGREGGGAEFVAFAAAVDEARAQFEAGMAEAVARSAKTSWRAAAWMLERSFPGRWAAVRPSSTTEEGPPDALAGLDELAKRRRAG